MTNTDPQACEECGCFHDPQTSACAGMESLAPAQCSASEGSGRKRCPECGGSGWVQDDAWIGANMRKVRGTLSLREMGAKLGFSAAYLSDLELGRRRWSSKLKYSYLEHGTESPLKQND